MNVCSPVRADGRVFTNFLFGFTLRRVFTCEVQMADSQALLADRLSPGEAACL
jgi:hypothetical protein